MLVLLVLLVLGGCGTSRGARRGGGRGGGMAAASVQATVQAPVGGTVVGVVVVGGGLVVLLLGRGAGGHSLPRLTPSVQASCLDVRVLKTGLKTYFTTLFGEGLPR